MLAELAYGVEASQDRSRNLQRLKIALSSLKVWPVTEAAAFEYGRIAAELRRNGRVIGQNDMMIAAIANCLGNCTIVTADSDFNQVAGLNIENWLP